MTPSLSISDGDLHVWHAGLDAAPDVTDLCASSLSDEELARAARFRFDHHRRRFIVARAVLRRILGTLLEVAPARVRFRYGDRGKPFLAEEFDRQGISFNIAHSQAHAIFAVAHAEVGVDIEQVRPVPDAVALADRFFSHQESTVLRALPAACRETAFLQVWTRKEAYIKALGEGLSHPLDSFSVTVAPGEPARLLETRDQGTRWWLHDLSQLPDYAAAVAIDRQPTRLHVGSCSPGDVARPF